MQTDTYLEVLTDRAPEEEVGVQTDATLDRPPSPLFVPQTVSTTRAPSTTLYSLASPTPHLSQSGVDEETQIEAGDLFDFDYEVAPLLDVLVGKTLEQALAEALREDELSAIRTKQAEFEAVRAGELGEVQRLEAEVMRRAAEKARRREQEEARIRREAEVREKVAAAAFARSYLASMRRSVFQQLHESGHFYDPVKRSMEAEVLPGVLVEVANRLSARQGPARSLADTLIEAAVEAAQERFTAYQASVAAAAAKAAADRAAAAEAAAAALAAEAATGESKEGEEAPAPE